ncbi:early transcribed membrane protein 10.3 [Plasmodium gaboni]|uniref:Early transcribed membrane protein 10.3 n=1 Tax=Plasmodium gaboni TaxID=647221 RepID=A0A151LKP4_9APIC|nr:early transcribed membrane protein 10.3 [Plasmodium gaboni]KYN99548.1 early transcribed membrane protein 10.3 [Plasmodium gaboni]SOV14822.1 protein of early gametocyte 4 [Plasmodium gaboni]
MKSSSHIILLNIILFVSFLGCVLSLNLFSGNEDKHALKDIDKTLENLLKKKKILISTAAVALAITLGGLFGSIGYKSWKNKNNKKDKVNDGSDSEELDSSKDDKDE